MYRIIYLLMCLIALIIYGMQKMMLPLPSFINNYVNDFLCLPIILGGISFAIRRLKKDPFFRLPLVFIICFAAYYSFYFEYYLPQINPRYTSDWIDVALYFLGGFVYFFGENKLLQ
ncbi:hypothetical protein [Flavobacterium sp. 270]|uniref:hypothetical protein n=1 Tax=Flavobacterium sp. 270 TaxID=2512114 RepID=UPI001FB92E37|nr:hypothetical protein [Flavobacterium sp. 270]